MILRLARPHHWIKNILVFVPIILGHRLDHTEDLQRVIATFFALSLGASALYIINDIRDAEHDRAHPSKRHRPIASGAVGVGTALVFSLLLAVGAAALGFFIGLKVSLWLITYAAMSLLYSVWFKKRVALDVIVLSALYTLRILAGGAAANIIVTDWLIAFSSFLFLGLALLKRYADLGFLHDRGETLALGRDYFVNDRELIRSMGVASSMISVLVLALYIRDDAARQLYPDHRWLWLICPLYLYWIAHMWFLAYRRRIEDDPIVVAGRDPVSYAVAILICVVAYAAL
jgi:4-hydroxybenzoate polyprenyltransferase